MKSDKFTQGPWAAVRLPDGGWSIDSETCDGIAELDCRVEWRPKRSESGNWAQVRLEWDARLIAAAPEMFAVLDRLINMDPVKLSEMESVVRKVRGL